MIRPKDVTKPRGTSAASRLLRATEDLVFHHMHGGQLIYNTSWEDPRIDRQLMNLDGKSRVVMITSAGCNALDYLLDGPAEIHAVDVNYRQNALLELKLAMIRRGEFADFLRCARDRPHTSYEIVYRPCSVICPYSPASFGTTGLISSIRAD